VKCFFLGLRGNSFFRIEIGSIFAAPLFSPVLFGEFADFGHISRILAPNSKFSPVNHPVIEFSNESGPPSALQVIGL
jgi:hypothetical protein